MAKKYTVTLTRTTVEKTTLTVEASSRVHAAFIAAKTPSIEWHGDEPVETIDVGEVEAANG
jgi:hypothetical protein